ncbi:MAG: hypothetical protein H0U70_04610 [Tatlockia sp.]|nr:hypothetical protein [Tatlockia sp.]
MFSNVKLGLIPILISTVVIAIMIFSLYVTVKYQSPEQYKKTRLHVFFTTLASVAIIFVGMNIVLTSLSFQYNQNFSRLTKTKEAIDKLALYPNQLLINLHNLRHEFVAGFFMTNLELYNKYIKKEDKKTDLPFNTIIEEQFVADVMIQSWEDCLTYRKYDLTPMDVWIQTFILWAQNPYFKAYYDKMIFAYNPTTKQFGDLLFEYAATIPVPTKDLTIYAKTIEKLTHDPKYIALIKTLN